MYREFYGLSEKPFNLTPDPRFLYLSKKHKEAFAHLMYGIRHRSGFVMVSGEIGTGKTTICRSLLKQLDPDIEVALIFNPYLSPQELLKCINKDFGIESESTSILELIEELNAYLLERASAGKNCVLIIDEAQDLSAGILEQIRLLSNLETEKEKLLQIMLIGQPELAQKLELNELRQLNQRITARYHLEALSEEETLQYVAFRLRVAGGRKKVRFTRKAIRKIYAISGGTPRVINALCDRALLIGYTRELREITPQIIKMAAKEIQGNEHVRIRRLDIASILRTAGVLVSAALVVLVIVLLTSGPIRLGGGSEGDGTVPVAEVLPLERTLNPGSQVDAIVSVPDAVESAEVFAEPEMEMAHEHDDSHNPTPARVELVAEEPVEPVPAEGLVVASVPEPIEEPVIDVVEESVLEESASPAEELVVASVPETLAEPVEMVTKVARASVEVERESLQGALGSLLSAWGLAAVSDFPETTRYQDIVAFAVAHGFSANRIEPSMDQLITLNCPVMLDVDFGEGAQRVSLLKVEGLVASISSKSGDFKSIAMSDLKRAYLNSAIVFWIDEYLYREPLRITEQGEPVWELQVDLAKLGILKTEPNGVYDDSTAEIVSEIQAVCGVRVDGIFGAQTRMVLSSWMGDGGVPHLTGEAFPAELFTGSTAMAIVEAPKEYPILTNVPTEEESEVVPDAPAEVEVPDGTADVELLAPLLEVNDGPSSDSVTDPAGEIVPLVPSRDVESEVVE